MEKDVEMTDERSWASGLFMDKEMAVESRARSDQASDTLHPRARRMYPIGKIINPRALNQGNTRIIEVNDASA
jgi:hypothetical protein